MRHHFHNPKADRRQSKAIPKQIRKKPAPETCVPCIICGQPVALEMAKTDDDGQAVHENCYVHKLAVNTGTGPN